MNIKHHDIEIPSDDPFKYCQLHRKKYAELLTEIIGTYSDGFVLAIDNKWGTGKTTFVNMWKKYLEVENFKTLYFNAWINDFESNALIAILSELKTIATKEKSETFKSVLTKGAVISKNLVPQLAKAIAKRYIDIGAIDDAIESVTKSAVDILKDEIDDYAKKKKGLLEFKIELESFIKENVNEKPLVFIIDELDRCRPDYAVEILENIKHFFSVKGIVFILSIDKIQLGNAIKGFYGSDQIDANEYLRRFIDVEYNLPQPPIKLFNNYLFEYYQFNEFFSKERSKIGEYQDDQSIFLDLANALFGYDDSSLRQQEKIFAHARIVLNLFPANNYIFPNVLFLLIYIRDLHKNFYSEIKNKKLTVQDFANELRSLLPKIINEEDLREYIYLEARILTYYSNFLNDNNRRSRLITVDTTSREKTLLVTSGFGIDSNDDLLHAIDILDNSRLRDIKLSYLLNKIDLLSSISAP